MGRTLGAGLALVLLLGASGEGCDSASSGGDSDCPRIEAAGAALAVAAVRLPADDLDDDIDRVTEIAQRVADARDDSCARSAKGLGYKIVIPLKRDDRTIEVRVMARNSQDNYYRVVVPNKDAYDKDGDKSNNPNRTHIDIDDDPDDTVDNILDIVDKIKDDYS